MIIESVDTFAFMGFNDATASRLWDMHLRGSKDKEMHQGFFSMAEMWLEDWFPETVKDVQDDDDEEWYACLARLGVREDLQRLIMLPEYSDVRLTSSCKGWVREIMTENFKSLDLLEEQVRAGDRLRRALREQPTDRKPGGSYTTASGTGVPTAGPPSSSISHPSSSSSSSARGSAAHIPPGSSEKSSGEQATPAVADTTSGPRVLPGHTMLWRGGSRTSAKEFFNPDTGDVFMLKVYNSKPADFSSRPRAYWTPQKETADKFAGYCKQIYALDQIAIIQLAVPSDWVESLQKAYLWNHSGPSGDIWRELVFSSRRQLKLPKEIHYIGSTPLLIGDIASGTSQRYDKMTHHSQIQPRHVIRVKVGEEWVNAIQWVFQGEGLEGELEEKCHGKVWVHAFVNRTG